MFSKVAFLKFTTTEIRNDLYPLSPHPTVALIQTVHLEQLQEEAVLIQHQNMTRANSPYLFIVWGLCVDDGDIFNYGELSEECCCTLIMLPNA